MPRRSEGPKRFTTLVRVFAMRTMKNLMVQLQIIEKKILEEWRAKAMPTTPLRQCKLLAANTPAPCDRLETGNYLVPS